MSDAPEWVRTSVRLWTEDDTRVSDREKAPQAWKRLFGEPYLRAKIFEIYDYGDGADELHEHGRIMGSCYEGGYIDLTLEAAEKYVGQLRRKVQQDTWELERLEGQIQKYRPKLTEEEIAEVRVLWKYRAGLITTLAGPIAELLERARKAGVL